MSELTVTMEKTISDTATCGIVIQEVLQGVTPAHYADQVRYSLLSHHYLEAPREVYLCAAEYTRRCRSHGLALTTVDALIAALAAYHSVSLWTLDRDFARVAHLLRIRLYRKT